MQQRKTAVLMEETTPEIFKIKLGQLKPGAGAKISIVYISELPAEEKAIRLTIPTTIAPRYVPSTDHSKAAQTMSAIPYSSDSPCPLAFELKVMSQSKIKSIKSPSHNLETEIERGENEDGQYNATAKFAGRTADLDRDLVVLIENSNPHKPVVFIEKSDDDNMIVAMVSLVPSFKLTDQPVEMVFLVDRSGSMGFMGYGGEGGGSIVQAKKALELFLHSLPVDCYFNIFSFGSNFDSLFSGSRKYDDNSLNAATAHAATMSADYGGTEIYRPLEAIFQEPRKPGFNFTNTSQAAFSYGCIFQSFYVLTVLFVCKTCL